MFASESSNFQSQISIIEAPERVINILSNVATINILSNVATINIQYNVATCQKFVTLV